MEGVLYWCLIDEQNPAAGAGQWQEVICGVAYYRQASVEIDLMTYLYRQKAFVNPASSDELSPSPSMKKGLSLSRPCLLSVSLCVP
jgi:hypothetical protein